MRFERMFTTIDTHTCGDPTRTITGEIPVIPGKTIPEKMLYLKENQDWIRRVLMFEPRGNEVQSGVILTKPYTPGTDIGIIYIEVGGYLTMCGHDTIGVATALVESGMVKLKEPVTQISLDTPAGLVNVSVNVEQGIASEVTFTNAPAFLFKRDILIHIPGIGNVKADVSFGGLYYTIVEASDLGVDLTKKSNKELTRLGMLIRDAINSQIDVYHLQMEFIKEASHVLFSGTSDHPEGTLKNAVVIPPGSVSRYPCGTGTCAKLAQLYTKGELKMGETFGHESATTGTLFKSKIERKQRLEILKQLFVM